MIEYLYSRIMVTIASIALVAVVVSVSTVAADLARQGQIDSVASGISGAISAAGSLEEGLLEQVVRLDHSIGSNALTVNLSKHWVNVTDGHHRCSRHLDLPIILESADRQVDYLVVLQGSALLIRAEKLLFVKSAVVTVAEYDAASLTLPA